MNCAQLITETPTPSRAFSAGILAIPAEPLAGRAKLTINEMISLHDALETVEKVIHGLSHWPCFQKNDIEFNAAGAELDDMRMRICRRLECLIDEVRAQNPRDGGEDWFRTAFLLRHDVENDPKLATIAKTAVYERRPDLA